MEPRAKIRTRDRDPRPPGSPPAVWTAFVAASAWKSWTIVALLGVVMLLATALVRLAGRPPEYVLVDAAGNATPIKRSVATDALLQFLADRTRPPEMTIVRFTRDFLHLALAVNSSTIEANWPAALERMSPELRARLEAEASTQKLVETYRLAQRKTELTFEEIVLEDRTPTLLTVRVTLSRRMSPLIDGAGSTTTDRVQVELVERIVPPTPDHPDGLEVAEWRLTSLPERASAEPVGPGTKEVSRAP